jgi:hypothetical protein
MASSTRNRKNKGLDAPTKRVSAESWSDHTPSANGYASSLVWAPFDRVSARVGIVILGYIMELLGTFIFTLFLNLARQNLPPVTTVVGDATQTIVLGIVGGGTWYMATGFRLQPDEQPRHLSWTVTGASILTFRTGLLPGLIYLCAQTGGAALAGVTLWGLSVKIVPGATTVALATAIGFEILGTFVIILPLLYNTMLGVPLDEEARNLRDGQKMAAAGRVLATTALLAGNSYSFDAVVYIAGLIGFGLLADSNNPYVASPAIYILVPFAGMLAAVVVYYVLLGLFKCSTPTKVRRGARGDTDENVQRHIDEPVPQASLDEIVTRHRSN